MNLGETIRHQRKKQKLSQGELAESIGITQAYLSQIEKNKKEPNLSTLKKLSGTLSIPLPVLFFKAMDENDVPIEKKEMFNSLNKTIEDLIDKIFFNEIIQ